MDRIYFLVIAATLELLSNLVLVECDAIQCTSKESCNFESQLQVTSDMDSNTSCVNTWFFPAPNDDSICECGSTLGNKVKCNNETKEVDILDCYCMTYSEENHSQVVGQCLYGCSHESQYHSLPSNISQLNEKVCGWLNREGQLCGRCKDGFAPAVYSYDISCVECKDYHYNWLKYAVISLLPLTIFFFVVTLSGIKLLSGAWSGFILITQVMSTPILMRAMLLYYHSNKTFQFTLVILSVPYGVSNLDFFRLLYPPFCLHPHMSTVQAMALDYIIGVYPLALIVFTYFLVVLRDYNLRVLLWLWKPFRYCSVRFRRNWNIKSSLVDSFATFIILSYMKFLDVSVNLLIPIHIFNIHGQSVGMYVFYDATVKYFSKEHLPYAFLALGVFLTFNVFPVVLLSLYPCQCFQKCLNRCRLGNWQALHIFMDAFQGCYKDGTNGTKDCRWYAAVYLLVRITFFVVIVIALSDLWLPFVTFSILIMLILITAFHPYKSPTFNTVETILFLAALFILVSGMAPVITYTESHQFQKMLDIIGGIFAFVPLMYVVGVLLYKLLSHSHCVQVYRKVKTWLLCYCKDSIAHADSQESLPDRIAYDHPEETTALLPVPVQWDKESDSNSEITHY